MKLFKMAQKHYICIFLSQAREKLKQYQFIVFAWSDFLGRLTNDYFCQPSAWSIEVHFNFLRTGFFVVLFLGLQAFTTAYITAPKLLSFITVNKMKFFLCLQFRVRFNSVNFLN